MEHDMRWLKATKYMMLIGTILLCLFVVYLGTGNCLSDPKAFQQMLQGFGLLAPLAFIAIQIIQTVLPIIPGGVSSAVGIIVFGPLEGFIYNYVGLLIGAYLAFRMVRRYGKQFILKKEKKKTYDKYIGWLEKGKKFDFFFALAIFLPGMPDDILCMICALTTMSTKRFMLINLLCKPFGLILYSFGMKEILLLLSRFF